MYHFGLITCIDISDLKRLQAAGGKHHIYVTEQIINGLHNHTGHIVSHDSH